MDSTYYVLKHEESVNLVTFLLMWDYGPCVFRCTSLDYIVRSQHVKLDSNRKLPTNGIFMAKGNHSLQKLQARGSYHAVHHVRSRPYLRPIGFERNYPGSRQDNSHKCHRTSFYPFYTRRSEKNDCLDGGGRGCARIKEVRIMI